MSSNIMAIPLNYLKYLPLSGVCGFALILVYILYLAAKSYGDVASGPASTTEDYVPIIYGKLCKIRLQD